MKKNMFKVMALSLAMATLSTTAAFAAGWGKVGSEWYYYQEDGTVARNTWINTLVSNDESGELTYQVGNKDFATEEGKTIAASYWVQGNGTMAGQLLGSRRRCMVSCGCKGSDPERPGL